MADELILVADDSATVVEMLKALLEGAGFRVTAAADGIGAAEKAFSERPDLVLLDVAMPHMNGYQVCRLLKSDANLRDTPVLLLTSKDQVSDKFWGVQSGADRYLTKECSPDELLAVVRETLAKRPIAKPGARRPVGTQTAPLDLLSRLNDLLDRRLFQTTILNEIARLARSLQDLEQCANAVMKILSQLVDYHLAGVALSEEEHGELYVRQARAVTRSCLDRFEKDCFNAVAAQIDRVPPREQWRVSVFDESQAGEPADDLEQFIALPLEAEDRPVGLLAFAGRTQAAVAQDDQALLSSVADQVYIVLDNARLYRTVQVMAVSDELTGLYNFRHLRERLAEEFARARRSGSEMALILLDIDHFKAVNDRCGHQTGNLVLTQVVSAIRGQIREYDVAARYGGEEFAIILPMTGLEGAVEVAERLRLAVAEKRFGEESDPLRLTISLGVAAYPAVPVAAPDDLITESDNALYAAKEDGRNCVRYVGGLGRERGPARTDSTAA
ncbi:MAG: diguanylate cyclase [Armatimonadota bacterium]|nr:MAG: diguanylate cyclase [Armatimonadota bacterium]